MPDKGASLPLNQRPASRWKGPLRALFLIAVAIAAAIVIWRDADAIGAALLRASAGLVGAALLFSLVNVVLTGVSWRMLLHNAPDRPSWATSARIFFTGQLGKYLPGSLWSFVASAELANQAGLSRTMAVSSLALAVLIGLGAGGLLALTILPGAFEMLDLNGWFALAVLGAGGLLWWPSSRRMILRLARIDFPITAATLTGSSAVAVLAWVFSGTQVVLIALGLGIEVPLAQVPQWIGIYALAWVAGFLFFIAPAGLGAREGVLVSLLALQLPLAEAVTIALLSRVVTTAADFVLGLGALAISKQGQAAPAIRAHPHQG